MKVRLHLPIVSVFTSLSITLLSAVNLVQAAEATETVVMNGNSNVKCEEDVSQHQHPLLSQNHNLNPSRSLLLSRV